MIEDLMRHLRTILLTDEDLVDQSFRSPFFEDLEEINWAFEIKECKRRVNIMRLYQCGIAVYPLVKLRTMEFYCDFLDKYLDRRDFELIQIDTYSMYMVISGNSINEIVQLELWEEYHNGGKAKFLSMSKYHDRTPGLFKQEFQGMRMIALTSKCYYADTYGLVYGQDDKSRAKFSCNGVSRKQNPMFWERYLEALNGSINKAQNTGFRLLGSGIVTYIQPKLDLSAYYDKQVVLPDGIQTEPLRWIL